MQDGSADDAATPVRLRVYDLSQGLARQMSAQLVGQQFDLIPHTGVEVYGLEYFFGGGVQYRLIVASHRVISACRGGRTRM